jgi:peroxiredoxin
LQTSLSAGYLTFKWLMAPWLWLARRFGWNGTWPRRLDAAVNRVALPLTESADQQPRSDVQPSVGLGASLPDLPLRFDDGSTRSLLTLRGQPLLLALIRGSWCSYSRLHVADLAAAAPELEACGIRMLAVSSYDDIAWWRRHGVGIPMATDPEGRLFGALGLRTQAWLDQAWGRITPHESVLLFDAAGRLVAMDVRQVSGYRRGQTFLSAQEWIRIGQNRVRRVS